MTLDISGLVTVLRHRRQASAGPSGYPEPSQNHALILTESKGYLAHQTAELDSLDNKANLVAATATALVAGFLALIKSGDADKSRPFSVALAGLSLSVSAHTLHLLLYLTAFVGYLVRALLHLPGESVGKLERRPQSHYPVERILAVYRRQDGSGPGGHDGVGGEGEQRTAQSQTRLGGSLVPFAVGGCHDCRRRRPDRGMA